MASKKTQQELEQPVKGYELEAVRTQVENLEKVVTKGFEQANHSLNTLLIKSETQVTPQQLVDNITALKKSTEDYVQEEVKKIHLEYRPMKNNIRWLMLGLGGQLLVIIGQLILTSIT